MGNIVNTLGHYGGRIIICVMHKHRHTFI